MNNLILLLLILTCSIATDHALANEPLGTPDIEDMVLYDDEENTPEEAALGKILFFDKRLSVNFKQSCATCHHPKKGFSDGVAFGEGTKKNPLGRNTPHLYNLGWGSTFMWDGREPDLESQALGPIKSEDEMMLPIPELEKRLNAVPEYKRLFKEAYNVTNITSLEVGRAIAAFERTIYVDNTPFDQYIAGNKKAMSKPAIRGLALYKTKGNCIQCHDGVNFTDDSFHSLGFKDGDIGRAKISKDQTQLGAFKTPGLRNIELSAPYMHNGSQATLLDVIEFYDIGGGGAKHTDKLIKPLNLTQQEKKDLVAFLQALTQPLNITAPKVP